MRKMTKIKNLLLSMIMIAFIVVLLSFIRFGPVLIILLVGAGLIVSGVRTLIFYITMARYMVGGKRIFFNSILLLDLGVFMMTGSKVSEQLVLFYLTAILAIAGVIDIIRALESKKEGAPWKGRLLRGMVTIAILILTNIFKKQPNIVVYLFCIELLYYAVSKIISVFRKTAVIYIPE